MRHIFIFLLIISVIAGCSKKPVDKAKQFIEAGMYGDAIPLLEEEIQKNPKNTEAHYLLGMAFLNLAEEDGASQSFDRAIKLDQKKYTKKTTEAYHKTGLNFLGQDTPAGVRRGLRYLNQALDTDASLKSEISKAYRDRGIALAKNDKSLSYILLTLALELDPNLKRDNDFYYALYIEDVEDPELQNKGCEDFLSLFPESKHVEEVLYSMGNYQYSIADYQKSKQYFSQLGDRYPDTELGKKAKVMVDNITKMEQEIGQAELERARKIKQMEIEKAQQLKQMEVEKAEKLKQMEIQTAEKQKQMEIAQQKAEEDAKIKEAERKLNEARAPSALQGFWIVTYLFNGENRTGRLNLQVSGNTVTGTLNTGRTLAKLTNLSTVTGTINGSALSLTRTLGAEIQTWSGRVDAGSQTIQGSFIAQGQTYSWSATKER